MLDHEPMLIDRRIVLEGQSLVQAGWTVVLSTRGDGIKPPVEIERGIEVRRFVDPVDEMLAASPKEQDRQAAQSRELRLALDRQRIHGWLHSPANVALQNWLAASGMPRVLASLLHVLVWPPAAASVVRRRFPGVKRLFNRALEPLVYLVLLRPAFLMPYLRLLLDRLQNPAATTEPAAAGEPLASESWQTRLYADALRLKPDIVHVHDLPNLPMGHRLAQELGAVLVYDAHELYPMQYFANETRRRALLETERQLIVHADAVISVNAQCAEVLEREYPIEAVVPLTNATESPAGFDPSQRGRLWHERFHLAPDVKIMVFQGGINPVRNVDPLVEALAGTPDSIHIGFITYGKDIPYYDEMTRRLGVHHRVHYVVEIPWDEVNDWLASADVGVMPYQVTNFNAKISSPNKLYEFVVAGLPIIASTELDNVKAAIEADGLGVMTLLRGVETYRSVILEMFEAPGGPDRFRPAVLAARHNYMWSNEETKLLDLYRRLRPAIYVPKALRSAGTAVRPQPGETSCAA
jgi:glycosyltransferase involved in cell wall biosynthesis